MTDRSTGAAAQQHAQPFVHEELDAKSLHFGVLEIQSRMQIRRPEVLALEYTRLMMGFLLFRPEARRIAMIGLGGGSLAKFCHRHLPQAALVVIEINPHVIALRDAFHVPPDDARLRVIADDGARFVAHTGERFDVLMVDAFDAQGMPAALGTQRFYDDCLDVLAPDGMLAVNLHAGHPHFPVYLDRIGRSFGAGVLRVNDHDGSNSVVFAFKGGLRARGGRGPRQRPETLGDEPWQQLQAAFARIASAMRNQGVAVGPEKAIASSSTLP